MDQLPGSRRKSPWVLYVTILGLIAVLAIHGAKRIQAQPAQTPAAAPSVEAASQPATTPAAAATQAALEATTGPASQPATQPTTQAATQPAAAVSVKVGEVDTPFIQAAVVPITINSQVRSLKRVEMELTFDANIVRPLRLGDLPKRDLELGGSFTGDANERGRWRLIYIRNRPIEGNTVALTARFDALPRIWSPADEAKSSVGLSNVRAVDGNAPSAELTTATKTGAVTVKPPWDLYLLGMFLLILLVAGMVKFPALRRFAHQDKTFSCGKLLYSPKALIALFAWLLWGDFCFTLMETVVPSILPLKLRSLESPNLLIGAIMTTLPAVFNTTITPWVSFKSDRHRGPMGRRLPFIIYTMPFLAISLVLIGFSDDIGDWVHGAFLKDSGIGQAQVIIVLVAVFAACFDLFNMFVNTVYWYLFNDIVPQEMMGRFMGYFRMVGSVAGSLYNWFIFQYAETHMREIYLGAAILYAVGFGIMFLRIREGEYPPVENAGHKPSLWENIRTYARECFTIRYYIELFMINTFAAMSSTIGWAGVFFSMSLGLNTNYIGKMSAVPGLVLALCFGAVGSLVDRWHSVRSAAYVHAYGAFFALGGWVWLCIDKPPLEVYAWSGAIISSVFGSLLSATSQTAEMTRLMKLLPREKYGQFSGAMAMIRAVAIGAGGLLSGYYLDIWAHIFPKEIHGGYSYRFIFTWTAPLAILSFVFQYRNYRAWKRLGGDTGYVPPTAPFKLSDLKPWPGDTGKVKRGLLMIVCWAFLGGVLGNLTYIIYYMIGGMTIAGHTMPWARNTHDAAIFAIALGINIVLFIAYLRFVKFMERP